MIKLTTEIIDRIAFDVSTYITPELYDLIARIEHADSKIMEFQRLNEEDDLITHFHINLKKWEYKDFTALKDELIRIVDNYLINPHNILPINEQLKILDDDERTFIKLIEIRDPETLRFYQSYPRNWAELNEAVLELIILKNINFLNLDYNSEINNSIFIPDSFTSDFYNTIIKNPELIKTLHWRKFEQLIANLLEQFGYEVNLMQGTKDGGIDIIAFQNKNEFGAHKYIIQAKKWTNKVGIEPVRSLAFLREKHMASKACLVTTSTFTRGAWKLAEDYKWVLELKDINDLLKWIKTLPNSHSRYK